MHIILCLDDKNGMQFNHRRLSSDQAVGRRIYAQHTGSLWIHPNSSKLFVGTDVCADEAFLQRAKTGDTCFVETLAFTEYLAQVESIIIYRWNRHYPSDVKLPEQLLADWTLVATTDFPGYSHETITEEKYIK